MCLDKRLDVEYRKGSQQLNAIITTVSLLAVKLSPKWFASQRKARTEMIFELLYSQGACSPHYLLP